MAVVAGSVTALFVGFFGGYLCGRKCRKDEDDNLPYPDTEYEYFEQRQNMNRWDTRYIFFSIIELNSSLVQFTIRINRLKYTNFFLNIPSLENLEKYSLIFLNWNKQSYNYLKWTVN